MGMGSWGAMTTGGLWRRGYYRVYFSGIYRGRLGEKAVGMTYESELLPTNFFIDFSSEKLVEKVANGYRVTAVYFSVIARWVPGSR